MHCQYQRNVQCKNQLKYSEKFMNTLWMQKQSVKNHNLLGNFCCVFIVDTNDSLQDSPRSVTCQSSAVGTTTSLRLSHCHDLQQESLFKLFIRYTQEAREKAEKSSNQLLRGNVDASLLPLESLVTSVKCNTR